MPYKDPETQKEYMRQYGRQWHKDNQKVRLNSLYQRRYGITYEQKKQMLANQGGICSTCEDPLPFEKAMVDHCHTTGTIRGILCRKCNYLAGYLENPSYETMLRMVRYLWGPTCV